MSNIIYLFHKIKGVGNENSAFCPTQKAFLYIWCSRASDPFVKVRPEDR